MLSLGIDGFLGCLIYVNLVFGLELPLGLSFNANKGRGSKLTFGSTIGLTIGKASSISIVSSTGSITSSSRGLKAESFDVRFMTRSISSSFWLTVAGGERLPSSRVFSAVDSVFSKFA